MVVTGMIKQFNMTREVLLKTIRTVSESEANIIPKGFNNSLKWHIGHILFAANLAFSIFQSTSYLPEQYIEWFKPGTGPKDWTNDIPTLNELREQLEQQQAMVQEVFSDCLDQKLEKPFRVSNYGGHEFITVSEMLNFFIFHESMHIGYIQSIKLFIRAED
ncbi:DinB family protein [Marinicrinis lubricantis]|uniref:DinB family protein n=1 Tax=Marinicrinis lubricantis TaxID=2086470 RepID=A0ABW1ITC4_9BACL